MYVGIFCHIKYIRQEMMLLLLLEAREVKTCIESLLFIDSLESRPDSGRVPLGESTSL